MYMEHHEITVSSAFSTLECPWDGDTSTRNISVAYPWNSGHEQEMIVSCVVYKRLTCNHCVKCIGGSTCSSNEVTMYGDVMM